MGKIPAMKSYPEFCKLVLLKHESDTGHEALGHAGIDDFQLFPAILRNSKQNIEWTDYYAFNVIGMVDATDTENSLYGEVMGGNEEGVSLMGIFTAIALHEDKIRDLHMFREPIGNNLIMSERCLDSISELSPDGGFGITADEVVLT